MTVLTERSVFAGELRTWLKKALAERLQKLDRAEEEHIFQKPAQAMFDIPDYKLKIRHPMDLSNITLQSKESYSTVEAAKADFELMILNCRLYYGKETTYDQYAMNLLADAYKVFDELEADFVREQARYPDHADLLNRIWQRRLREHPLTSGLKPDEKEKYFAMVGKKGVIKAPSSPSPTPTPPTPTVTSTPAPSASITPQPPPSLNSRQLRPPSLQPLDTYVETPHVKKRKVEFNIPDAPPGCSAPVPLTGPPDVMGYGALTQKMREQLRDDKKSLQELCSSPSDEQVNATMDLNRQTWPVEAIIMAYLSRVEARQHLRDDEKQSITTVMHGLLQNFNTYATESLLYPVERRVVENFVLAYELSDGHQWGSYLGVRYLVRLLAVLPTRLQDTASLRDSKSILRIVQEFVMYLDGNWDQFNGARELQE